MSNRSFKLNVVSFLFILGLGYLGTKSIIMSTAMVRIGDRFGRTETWQQAALKIGEFPIWGYGSARVSNQMGEDLVVHNVVLALGMEYGVIATLLSGLIVFVNFLLFFYFINRWRYERDIRKKSQFVVYIVASLVITVRPNISGSSQNFYSLGEWACFALVLAGLSMSNDRFRINEFPQR